MATHGVFVLNTGGTFSYQADQHFHGADGFTFRANDGTLDSNLATVTITVRDATPPVLILPSDQLFEATSADGAVVHYTGATATDDSPPVTIVYLLPNDSLFALGRTSVHVTATDTAGNAAAGDFVVVVVDTTAPLLVVQGDVSAEATSAAGAVVVYPAATATDAVGPVTIVYSQAAGSVFALGVTTVFVRAQDAAGNATTKSFAIAVLDTTAPVLNLPASITTDATSPAGAIVSYTATATDNSGVSPTVTCAPASGSTFPIGTTTVSCTAKDAAGNASIGSFTVTVNAPSASAQTSNLIALVRSLNLAGGTSTSLSGKLQNAISSFASGNTTSACNQVNAFINEARAQSGKKLTASEASQLIADANQILTAQGCP